MSLVAQKGILAVAEVSPLPVTINVFVNNGMSKSIVLAEFAVRSLEVLVKAAHPSLFHEAHHEE